MGTPANIIVEFENKSFLLPKGKDQILLFRDLDGYPFEFHGVMYSMVKAYENLKNTKLYPEKLNILSPDNFASELVRLSLHKKLGFCGIMPASRLMYEQYDKDGFFVDKAYEYICNFKSDDCCGYDMTLTLKDYNHETTKGMNEWKKVCNIAYEIAHAQNENAILMNENVPCKICIVGPICVNTESDILFVNGICDDLKEYKKNEIERLRKKLPEWATPLVRHPSE